MKCSVTVLVLSPALSRFGKLKALSLSKGLNGSTTAKRKSAQEILSAGRSDAVAFTSPQSAQ